MRRIKLTVAYDGTDYRGWQSQENADTVEDRLNEALRSLLIDCHDPLLVGSGEADSGLPDSLSGNVAYDDVPVKEAGSIVIGASRTDAGVHAEGNVAVFDTEARMAADRFAYALNVRLPEDIRILRSEEVSGDFHPRYSPSHKTYEYQILNTSIPIPTYTRYTHHIYEDIDINKMREAVDLFIGERDFSAFCSAGAQVKSKVRTITALDITEERLGVCVHGAVDTDLIGSCVGNLEPSGSDRAAGAELPSGGTDPRPHRIIRIRVTGTGFLYNMVRIIAGTLIEVGLGRRSIDTVRQAIETGDRQLAGPTAPARGLTLKSIIYDI